MAAVVRQAAVAARASVPAVPIPAARPRTPYFITRPEPCPVGVGGVPQEGPGWTFLQTPSTPLTNTPVFLAGVVQAVTTRPMAVMAAEGAMVVSTGLEVAVVVPHWKAECQVRAGMAPTVSPSSPRFFEAIR